MTVVIGHKLANEKKSK